MGTKEESAHIRIVKGFSGQLRPNQAQAGRCRACKEPVFVESIGEAIRVRTERVEYFHYSCAAL